MITYQDLLEVGESEVFRMDFVRGVINKHQSSAAYLAAKSAELYYQGENPTISNYEKIIYDLQGRAQVDRWTANHKIASNFFGFVVDQEVSYLLGNGVSFGEDSTKEKLGADFDQEIMDAAETACVDGVAFGFWNLDHLDIFALTEFAPLYDEETGALMAGVRFWQLDKDKPIRATLYEPDGYTEYMWKDGEGEILREKTRYKITYAVSEADGAEIVAGENYASLPIVPLMRDDKCRSELAGKRNTLDALDLASSNMVNNVDEGNLIYWVLKGYGGMDDLDDVKFMERLKTIHVAHVDGSDTDAEAHTIEAPFEGTQATIDMLTNRLYDDFQAFNAAAVTAANQSATAIRASYVPLDLKCDKLERQVTRFILGVLKLAGIDDKPTYTRNQIINKQEEITTLIQAAMYFDEEYIRKKALTILGDIDQYEEMTDRLAGENLGRLSGIGGT